MTNDAINNSESSRLSRFYKSEYNYLVSAGLSHGFQLEQVKDVIHQLFLHLAEKKIDLDEIANPRSYILTAFKRKLIDIHRLNARRLLSDGFGGDEPTQRSADRVLEENETITRVAAELLRAYEQLPERCKKVIFLKYYGGLSNEEIKLRTGLSMRSIYNNISEGIKHLRHIMAPSDTSNFGKIAGLLLVLASIF